MLGELVLIDVQGWRQVVLMLIAVVCLLRFRRRPSFVLPVDKRTFWFFLEQGLFWSICALILMLPLDIHIAGKEKALATPVSDRILFVLDVSLSMTADDVSPSRFIMAKQLIEQLIRIYDESTYGLIVFSGLPVLQIPFTTDSDAVLTHIETLSLADFPPTHSFVGTALGDALLLAKDTLTRLPGNDLASSAIMLITDGDNSQGLHPLRVLAGFADDAVPVHTFALGQESYQVGVDSSGNDVFAYIDIPLLQEIADITDGYFLHITPTTTSGDFQYSLQDEMKEQQTILGRTYISLNTWLYTVLLILLGLYFCLKMSILLRIIALLRE